MGAYDGETQTHRSDPRAICAKLVRDFTSICVGTLARVMGSWLAALLVVLSGWHGHIGRGFKGDLVCTGSGTSAGVRHLCGRM